MTTETQCHPCFQFFVDGKEFHVQRPMLLVSRIMELAGVTPEQGLLLCLPDGTQEPLDPDQRVRLIPCARFERRPAFKRG